jgi:hypothetical protein
VVFNTDEVRVMEYAVLIVYALAQLAAVIYVSGMEMPLFKQYAKHNELVSGSPKKLSPARRKEPAQRSAPVLAKAA